MRKKYMPLVKFVQKHKVKLKTARCGDARVEYFRIDHL